jgi:hypothetical protein
MRKLTSEAERTIKALNNELSLKDRDIKHLNQQNMELKELLETYLKQNKPADLRHRMGECTLCSGRTVCMYLARHSSHSAYMFVLAQKIASFPAPRLFEVHRGTPQLRPGI